MTMSAKKLSAALIWLAVVSQGVFADPALELSLSGNREVNGVDNLNVVATLKNVGDVHLKLFNEPRGLLSPMATKSFKVAKSNGNGAATFVGLVAKYSFGQATSFTDLDPGQSIDVTHNLGNAYQLDSEGDYDITPETTFYYVGTDGEPVPIEATLTQTHSAKVVGDLTSRALQKRKEGYHQLRKRAATTSGCTSAQTDQIIQSTYVASLYAASAEKYLSMKTSSTDRFVQWFGEYDSGHHDTVLTHYTNIRSSDVKTYTYDCACTEGDDVYAYVYPDQFGHIYLCNQYMQADVSGTDSKAGTIIHESSHFIKNAGTKDLAYGQTRASALAVSNSTAAINNADSHEYFAENNPWQA